MMRVQRSREFPKTITASYEKYFIRRADRGLTETEVAKKIGINVSSLSRWRNGLATQSLKTLVKLAKLLDCNVSDFFEELPKVI